MVSKGWPLVPAEKAARPDEDERLQGAYQTGVIYCMPSIFKQAV